MTHFVPPLSGNFIGALIDAFELRATPRLKTSQARDYFAGKRIGREMRGEIIADFVDVLLEAKLLEIPGDAPPRPLVIAFFTSAVEEWDALVGTYMSAAPQIARTPTAVRGFARVLAIDVALRVAAIRRLCGLGTIGELEDRPGMFMRRLFEALELSRDDVVEKLRLSDVTIDAWCDAEAGIAEENLRAAANLVANKKHADEVFQVLRRHYGVWRLRRRLTAAVGPDFAGELLAAVRRVANAVIAGLARSRLPEGERRKAEHTIALLGRVFESTSYLRRHASRTENDRRWQAALVSDDLAYVEHFARQLAAIPLVRPMLVADGIPDDDLDEMLAVFADAPPLGLAPPNIATGAAFRITGDSAFKANNREALAEAAMLVGDLDGAIAHLQQAVEHEPTNAMWHFRLGALLGQRGLPAQGIAECEIAKALQPSWELPRVEVGIIQLDAGDAAAAVVTLEQARGATKEPSAHLLYHLGLAYLRTELLAKADEAFTASLKLRPDDPMCLDMAAEIAFRLGDTIRGRRLAKEAAHRGMPGSYMRWVAKAKT